MGTYDIPLESVIILISIILIYFAYKFHKNGGEAFKRPTKMFLIGFVILFISAIFDLLDEFFKHLIIDVAGEIFLIISFVTFILTLKYFKEVKEG
jgi:hypothetical protein